MCFCFQRDPFRIYCIFRKDNIKTMSERVKLMRTDLYKRLKSLGVPGSWDHIVSQKGMFSYTGLNGESFIVSQQNV